MQGEGRGMTERVRGLPWYVCLCAPRPGTTCSTWYSRIDLEAALSDLDFLVCVADLKWAAIISTVSMVTSQ